MSGYLGSLGPTYLAGDDSTLTSLRDERGHVVLVNHGDTRGPRILGIPRNYQRLMLRGVVVEDSVLSGIWAFLTAYFLIAVVGAAVLGGHGYDVMTSISASLTAIGNVGPGLGSVGAYDNFAHFPVLVKITLAVLMLFGRLEIFTLLALFSREFWRR